MTIKKQLFAISLFLLLPAGVSAATISLRAAPATVGVGDTVQMTVLLDSAIATNAFSGSLVYSAATLEPIAISDGNSIISLWITHPAVPAAGAPITFAGITPGGFSGNGGVLFSVLFRAKAAGAAKISLGNVEVLRNDGAGGNEPVTLEPFVLSIGLKPLGGYTEPADHTPPEPFTAYLGNDAQLFGGRNYLIFTTVDKGSGMDHYTIAESRLPAFLSVFFPLTWSTTTSPYMLVDQKLTSAVYIKAIDRAGNERLSVFPPRYFFTSYEWAALLVILIGVVFLWKIQRGRRSRKNS
jgi:hypothetical protein